MLLVADELEPRVKCVVHDEPAAEHFMVVGRIVRKSKRHGQEPRALGREV